MEWINRIGMLLLFISFWLVTPEILGEARLKKLESRIEASIAFIPFLIGILLVMLLFALLLASGVSWAAIMIYLFPASRGGSPPAFWQFFLSVILLIGLMLMLINLFTGGLLERLSDAIYKNMVEPSINYFADNSSIRQRCLSIGIILFIVGSAMQLIATFKIG